MLRNKLGQLQSFVGGKEFGVIDVWNKIGREGSG